MSEGFKSWTCWNPNLAQSLRELDASTDELAVSTSRFKERLDQHEKNTGVHATPINPWFANRRSAKR